MSDFEANQNRNILLSFSDFTTTTNSYQRTRIFCTGTKG